QPNPDLTVLYQSSQQSVRAASTQQLQQLLGSGGVAAEQSGPFVLAAAYQAGAAPPSMPGQPAPPPPADGARAVIISSAPMLYDGNFSALGNRSFVQAAINWTAGEEELVSIPPKPPVENKLEMPDRTRLFAMLFGALVMPALA